MTDFVFGRGERAQLAAAFDPGQRVLVVATEGRLPALDETLDALDLPWTRVATFADVPQHVPRSTLDAAAALVEEHRVTGALAFGGGSPIGVVKALAISFDLRKVFVPTTFSGSEATNIWAVSEDGGKTTARDERARGDLVIYDADLVDSMPLRLVFVSLFNAMAHAVEALYAPDADEVVLADAEAGAKLLSEAIDVLAAGDDREARERALRGAYHAGRALDAAQMGIHHKMAHVLGGTLGLSHSDVHTALLPYSITYNREFAVEAMDRLAAALGGDPVHVVVDLQRRAGVPRALRDLGMAEHDIDRVVDELFTRPYPNPRPLDREALRALIRAAWSGELAGSP